MFTFFSNTIEMAEFDIEVKLGTEIVQKQHLQLPNIMVEPQCKQLVMQIANEQQPMQITFTTRELMDMSKYNQQDKYAINTLVFNNNAYIDAFPEEFNEN